MANSAFIISQEAQVIAGRVAARELGLAADLEIKNGGVISRDIYDCYGTALVNLMSLEKAVNTAIAKIVEMKVRCRVE